MRRIAAQLISLLTPGVRGLLGLLSLAYLAIGVGQWTRACHLDAWLALRPSAVCQGRVWQILTYPLAPANGLEFVINAIVIAWLGAMLEREWRRGQLWIFCAVVALGAGLVKLAVGVFSPGPLSGAAPIVFGLFAAWAKVFGHERVAILGLGETSARWCALMLGGVSFLMILMQVGWIDSLVMISGGIAGWLFLTLRQRQCHSQPARLVANERVRRLEL